jgi:hypothetical protein
MFLQSNAPKVELRDRGQRLLLNQLFETDFRASAAAHTFELSEAPFTIHAFRSTTTSRTAPDLAATPLQSLLSLRFSLFPAATPPPVLRLGFSVNPPTAEACELAMNAVAARSAS